MSMEKALTAKEICAIIKACASAHVEEFTLGELKLNFSKKAEIEFGKKPIDLHVPYNPAPVYTAPIDGTYLINRDGNSSVVLAKAGETLVKKDEPPFDEDDFNLQLAIEDHVEWERRQLEDELNAKEA